MRPDVYRLVGTNSLRIRQSSSLARIVDRIEAYPNELFHIHNTNQPEVVATLDVQRNAFHVLHHHKHMPIEQWPAWVDTLHTLLTIHHPNLRTTP